MVRSKRYVVTGMKVLRARGALPRGRRQGARAKIGSCRKALPTRKRRLANALFLCILDRFLLLFDHIQTCMTERKGAATCTRSGGSAADNNFVTLPGTDVPPFCYQYSYTR